MALFFSFLIAMLVTMALIPPLIRVAGRWQIVDLPNERKVHLHAIPRVGGLAMAVGAMRQGKHAAVEVPAATTVIVTVAEAVSVPSVMV